MANVGNPERVRWHHLAHSGANQNTGFASYTLTGYQERPVRSYHQRVFRSLLGHQNKFPSTKYDQLSFNSSHKKTSRSTAVTKMNNIDQCYNCIDQYWSMPSFQILARYATHVKMEELVSQMVIAPLVSALLTIKGKTVIKVGTV